MIKGGEVKQKTGVVCFVDKKTKGVTVKKRIIAMICLSLVFAFNAFARGMSGGRSFSSGRSSFSSSRTSSYKPTTSKTSYSKSSFSRSSTKSKKSSSLKATKASANSFKSRKDAVNTFKARNSQKYTSKYATKPEKRPEHIPQSTKVGGQNVNVTYNVNHGGYGYMHPTLGTWMMYDMMSDAIMLNTMMAKNNYVVESQNTRNVTVVRESNHFWGAVWTIVILLIIACVIAASLG